MCVDDGTIDRASKFSMRTGGRADVQAGSGFTMVGNNPDLRAGREWGDFW